MSTVTLSDNEKTIITEYARIKGVEVASPTKTYIVTVDGDFNDVVRGQLRDAGITIDDEFEYAFQKPADYVRWSDQENVGPTRNNFAWREDALLCNVDVFGLLLTTFGLRDWHRLKLYMKLIFECLATQVCLSHPPCLLFGSIFLSLLAL